MGGISWCLHWENHWWHLVGQSDLTNKYFVSITMGWASRFLRQIGTREESGCNFPYVAVGTMGVGRWGSHAGLASMWACMQYPQMLVLPYILMVPNRGIVTLYVVQVCCWTSTRQNSLGAVRSGATESDPLCSTQSPLMPLLGSWSDPDITAL